MEKIFSHDLLQSLYERASSVLHDGASPSILREPLDQLAEMARFRESGQGHRALEEARRLHDSVDLDIDRATMVYHNGEDGYWVMGWCFVPNFDVESGEVEFESDNPVILH